MKRLAAVAALIAVSTLNPAPESYGFVARLGRDTISVERITRRADTLVSDEVDRFPRVRRRHTEITLAPDGSIRHLVMTVRTPSEPPKQRERRIVADVGSDSVRISKVDSAGTTYRAFATRGELAMAHLPQMYSLYELYFVAALRHGGTVKRAVKDTVHLRQFYIDREFDNFPLHEGWVHPLAGGKVEIWHDWLAGSGEAMFDANYHMLTYSGAKSTYKVEVKRITELPDVEAIGARFAAAETNAGGMVQLSVRDTARGGAGAATFIVDYGRPLARGRVLVGDVIPYDEVWRTGANAATQFSTSAPITLAGLQLPAGKYTLWTAPHKDGSVDLIVNKQTGQWGTGYDESFDLGRAHLRVETAAASVEKFTISIVNSDASHGTLVMEWGTFRWTAPIVVR